MSISKTALLGCLISGLAAAGSPSWLQSAQNDRGEQRGRVEHEQRGREQHQQRQFGEEHRGIFIGGYYGPYRGYYGPYGYYYYPGGYYDGEGYYFGDGFSGYYTGPYYSRGEGTPVVIGRVLSDLSRPTYSYYSDHDRKNIAGAREDLEKFNANWQKGHFNKGQLDSAISRLNDLAQSDRLHPSTRAMYARDRDELRTFRETRGEYAYHR